MILTPQETLVRMISGISDNEEGRQLYIVHPIEGYVKELEDLTSLLPFKVIGFQCTEDAPLDSIQSLASFYLKIMMKIETQDPILLIGYSFGATVAFEMGLKLEAEGRKVQLFLIDGSPDFVRNQTSLFRAKIVDADESDAFSYYISFFKDIGSTEYHKLQQEFKELPDMGARLKLCAKKLAGEGESDEDVKKAALAFYKKVLAGEAYRPSTIFKGKLMLMKSDQNFVVLEKDYGLKKICKQVPEIYTFRTSHKEIIKAPTVRKIAKKIINSISS